MSDMIIRDKAEYHVRTTEQMERHLSVPPWSLRQKIALTCRILATEGHESAIAGQITARGERADTYWMLSFGLGFDEACASYAAVLELEPLRADTLNNMGLALMRLERHSEALEQFDAALAVDADNLGALHNRANALAELGAFEAALMPCDTVLRRCATKPRRSKKPRALSLASTVSRAVPRAAASRSTASHSMAPIPCPATAG